MNTPNANFDQPWKEAIEDYLERFLEFFFPQVHALVDWSRGYESLDKELQQISPSAESGEREGDKLFKVWQKNGEAAYLLIHVEIQSQRDNLFEERMYVYHYRSFDIHKRVISLAILGDDQPNWRPAGYGYELAGCSLEFKFPQVKLLDYESQWSSLENSSNPFALLVMAHLKTQATRGNAQDREGWKWTLVQLLYERDYTEEEVIRFFRVLDWMMTLPSVLQESFDSKLRQYQEERNMPILSNIERRALETGRQEGLQEGLLEATRVAIAEVLRARFGPVPTAGLERVNQIRDESQLRRLLQGAASLESWGSFEELLDELG